MLSNHKTIILLTAAAFIVPGCVDVPSTAPPPQKSKTSASIIEVEPAVEIPVGTAAPETDASNDAAVNTTEEEASALKLVDVTKAASSETSVH